MAKRKFYLRPALQQDIAVSIDTCARKNNAHQHNGAVIKILIFSTNTSLLDRAEYIIRRDIGSMLIQCYRGDGGLMAYCKTLELFNPSECLSFYHYHLDRVLEHQVPIWLTAQAQKGDRL